MSRYIFSALLCMAIPGELFAQAGRWLPTALRIGTDPGAVGYWIFSEQRNFFELTADADFNILYAVADYGSVRYTLDEDSFRYTNNGTYLRFGVDVNILKPDVHDNVIFFGLRYALSTFRDRLEYETGGILQTAELNRWPSTEAVASNGSAGSRWFEITGGLKMQVYKGLFMGFTARFKIIKKDRRDGNLRSYYVPGFGKNIDNNTWGLNYYIYYRFPFRKKETPPEEE